MDNFCMKCEFLIDKGICKKCNLKSNVPDEPSKTIVWFNKRKELLIPQTKNTQTIEGPQVEKYCNKCETVTNQTYFTAQLRSADEGQTVFYRCIHCLIQTFENS